MAKKKQPFVPYDYAAVYDKLLDDIAEDQARRLLDERGIVYATKEIRAGKQLEVEIYPEFTKTQAQRLIDPAARERMERARKNLNEKNSRKRFERKIAENFDDGDIWATFTYSDENMPESEEQADRDFVNYIRRLNRLRKKRGLPNARYAYVQECSKKGRWHHHFIMDGLLDMDTVESVWKLGRRNNVRRLAPDEDGLVGLAKYITKESAGKYKKKWKTSKGLSQPKESVNHYKFRKKHVQQAVEDVENLKERLAALYGNEGYVFRRAEIRFNEFNGQVYIYARMSKEKGKTSCRKKRDTKKDAAAPPPADGNTPGR